MRFFSVLLPFSSMVSPLSTKTVAGASLFGGARMREGAAWETTPVSRISRRLGPDEKRHETGNPRRYAFQPPSVREKNPSQDRSAMIERYS